MLFLLWLVLMCSLSSLDEIDGCVGLLVYDVWETEDDKTGFLSVGVDIFNLFSLYKWPDVLSNGGK